MYRIPTNSTQLTSLAGHIKISQVKVRETRKATSTDLDMALLNRAVFQKRNIPSLDRGRCNQTTEHYSDDYFFFFFSSLRLPFTREDNCDHFVSIVFLFFFIFYYCIYQIFFFFFHLFLQRCLRLPQPHAMRCDILSNYSSSFAWAAIRGSSANASLAKLIPSHAQIKAKLSRDNHGLFFFFFGTDV